MGARGYRGEKVKEVEGVQGGEGGLAHLQCTESHVPAKASICNTVTM
jgi:hypothetical protein